MLKNKIMKEKMSRKLKFAKQSIVNDSHSTAREVFVKRRTQINSRTLALVCFSLNRTVARCVTQTSSERKNKLKKKETTRQTNISNQ